MRMGIDRNMNRILTILISVILALFTAPAIAQAADPITISYSNVILDRTSISTGQSLNVTFDMRSTGLTTSPVQPSAFLEIADQSSECEEECGEIVTRMVSGNISQGKWSATITAGSALPSGTYRVVIWIGKLKGVSGALYYHNQSVILTNTYLPIKPTADPMSEKTKNFPTAKKDPSESTISKSKKITITCTKGKLVKKFSGANPKCPKGFKKG
jgi:hypothetical protein